MTSFERYSTPLFVDSVLSMFIQKTCLFGFCFQFDLRPQGAARLLRDEFDTFVKCIQTAALRTTRQISQLWHLPPINQSINILFYVFSHRGDIRQQQQQQQQQNYTNFPTRL